MQTQCTEHQLEFQGLGKRRVVARFDGGTLTSDAGALLLRETERRTGILRQVAACFTDHRQAAWVEHSVFALLAQRVYGLALGYADLNDHDELRSDPLLALLCGKADLTGAQRRQAQDRGKALAGKSTLNRWELTPADRITRYQKIVADHAALERVFVEVFLQAHSTPPAQIVLDLDATDDPLHGQQEGRFFHGYYGCYCYLPLYIFCGEHVLWAQLRSSNLDAAAGAVEAVAQIVAHVRQRWPAVRILLRGDSGFCREALMAWSETHGVDYVFGLAKNSRLLTELAESLRQAETQYELTGQAARVFHEFTYQTRETWNRARRVIGKAEHLAQGANPRFVVTSLSAADSAAQALYEDVYCARGDMENRIKEQQLDLFADRTSAASFRANQLRLWLASVAYVLVSALRRLGLQGTEWAKAQCGTIRLKVLKIGAQVRITARKVWVALASGYPYQTTWRQVLRNLQHAPPSAC